MKISQKINPLDNVAVALKDLEAGCLAEGVVLVEAVPAGHKFALETLSRESPVIKYGSQIGTVVTAIQAGGWVHDHNLKTGLSGPSEYSYNSGVEPLDMIDDHRTFMGYPREGGGVGVRNELWIIPTVGCVNGVAERATAEIRAEGLPDNIEDVVVFGHPYGCSQLGDDHVASRRILADMVHHSNAGGVLVLGLGCENNSMRSFKELVGPVDNRRVKFLVAQDVADELTECRELLRELRDHASAAIREPVPLSSLQVGLKCGGSDAFSGLTANPLVGALSDRLIARGGSAVLTEIPEIFGAEDLLFNRCINQSVFEKAVGLVNDFKQYFISHGESVGENPSPGNKTGGITTLEDKSLGCVQKGGRSSLNDVLRYGERIKSKGLTLLEGPGNDIVAVTALAAAGCQVVIFTTGRGTPLGGPVPVLKVASNSSLARKKENWIDFNAGSLCEGDVMDQLADRLFEQLLGVASGSPTRNEQSGYRDFAIWKQGVTL